MKKTTLILAVLMATLPLMADIFNYVDTATLSTNTAASYGQITITNASLPITNANYSILRTNNVQIGDALPVAFAKINSNFMALTNFLATNTFSGSGGASNAIGNLNGNGTNTTFYGTTWLDSSNLSVSQVTFGTSTNYVYFSNGGYVFQGLYAWNTASNCYINVLHSGGGSTFMYISNNTVFESAGFTYYTNATAFPGVANSWLSPAGPYSSNPGTLVYTNLADTIASGGTLNLTAANGVLVNGSPIGGVPFTNTTANAGVLSTGGIGTNLPVPYYAVTAGLATNAVVATNDPAGNPLASLLAATNAASGLFSGAISNWFGNGTNLTVYVYTTNITVLSLVTNGGIPHLTYQAIFTTTVYYFNTNSITLYGSGDTSAGYSPNHVFTWNSSLGEYVNTANTDYINNPGGTWQIYHSGGALYTNYLSPVSFPYAWGCYYDGNSPPSGFFNSTFATISVTNMYDSLGQALNQGANQYALNVNGGINANGYSQNGIPLQSVLQGMLYPYLWVTNCAGTATNLQGAFGNTGQGYYTNLLNGTLLIAGGYSASGVNTTNLSTAVSMLCSNWASIDLGGSVYGNATNVLGYYQVVQLGHDGMATNQPLVTVWNPGTSASVPIQTNSVGPHGITLLFTNGLFYGTTSY